MGRLEFNTQGRAVQLERVAETSLQVTPIGIRNRVQGVAMNNDKRWILPTLMSVAHLGSEYALARRLLLLDSRLKLAGQPRRGKLGKCGGMRGIHRLDQSIPALPVQCRYREIGTAS